MIDATEEGVGRGEDAPNRQIEVTITYLGGGIASVTCLCHRYVDLLQLIRMPEGWTIVNAAWCLRELGRATSSATGSRQGPAKSCPFQTPTHGRSRRLSHRLRRQIDRRLTDGYRVR